jgi:hypothetical protein
MTLANVAVTSTNGDITVNTVRVGLGNASVSTNTAVGVSALQANTTGLENVSVGYQSSYSNTTGFDNTAIGYTALYSNQTGRSSCAYGVRALYTSTVSDNAAFGVEALYSNTTGLYNFASGPRDAAGNAPMYSNTTGSYNIGIGAGALKSNTTASYNVAVGYQALYNKTGTGNYSVALGIQAGLNVTSGERNTFIGTTAGSSVTTGSYNTFVGCLDSTGGLAAGAAITTGSKNSILGNYSGNNGGLDIRTASNYIVLSDGDGNPQTSIDSTAKMTIGASGFNGGIRMPSTGGTIYIASITSNSQFQISYNSTSAGVALASGATSWSSFSDSRLKNVTGTYTNALSDILQIQPVKFTWKNDKTNTPKVGVLAQSVQNVVPEAMDSTTYEMDGDTEYLQVRYTELIPIMIASIQELKTIVDAQAAEIAALQAKVGA